jgi:hypothetical protein
MSMVANLQGRIENISLPVTHGLLPVVEAVAATIYSIKVFFVQTADCPLQVLVT